ncbi:DUF3592 domain-containing protein [Pseudomonas sp. MC042]|uniref:DUF3592 domain-containing protein n=1 Tax=Pseudomonas piscis TaxID=2614538 RepID=A0A7X1PRP3_9PSED|nr:DUF3592 domain-containing protein [Pseudomonas piscis]MQA57219.1 DUF3592 domain-containing protein [Pseudomonas piscis]
MGHLPRHEADLYIRHPLVPVLEWKEGRQIERARSARVRYVGKVLIFLVMLACGAGAYDSGWDYFALRVTGVYAPAQVVGVSRSRMVGVQSGHSYHSTRTVSYVVADGSVLTHTFGSEFSDSQVGDTVGVFYNPANPAEVIPDTWTQLYFASLLSIGTLVALGMLFGL